MAGEGRGARFDLGRPTRLSPREVWRDEARDFTYWLRNHPEILGEALGIDVLITDSEAGVGEFTVDIVGQDVSRDRRLMVENQLERTDHDHLGKLLTYAAGLDAATVVWISPEVRDEHREAIDWLNAHTDQTVDFFALELEVIQIGDSMPAPNLKPVATPNDWHKRGQQLIRQTTAPTEAGLARQRFFQAALEELKHRRPGITTARRVSTENWLPLSAGRTGFTFWWWHTREGSLRTCLVFEDPDPAVNDARFAWFLGRREVYEAEVGEALEWEPLPGRKQSRVGLSRALSGLGLDGDPQLIDWAVRSMIAINDAFRADIRAHPAGTIATPSVPTTPDA